MSRRRLGREFFEQDCETLSRKLLGKYLVREFTSEDGAKQKLSGIIVEVEAYLGGFLDKASHCYGNKKTEKNRCMYLPSGHSYIYKSYLGGNDCFNITCAKEPGTGAGVLIRALKPVEGYEVMKFNRVNGRQQKKESNITNFNVCAGPGRLCQALQLTRDEFDGIDMCDTNSALYVEEEVPAAAEPSAESSNNGTTVGISGSSLPPSEGQVVTETRRKERISFRCIVGCARININYAEEAVEFPFRFCLTQHHMFLSYPIPLKLTTVHQKALQVLQTSGKLYEQSVEVLVNIVQRQFKEVIIENATGNKQC